MGVPYFMEGSQILYKIGDPRVPKILENWGTGSGVPILGGPPFHMTPVYKELVRQL